MPTEIDYVVPTLGLCQTRRLREMIVKKGNNNRKRREIVIVKEG